MRACSSAIHLVKLRIFMSPMHKFHGIHAIKERISKHTECESHKLTRVSIWLYSVWIIFILVHPREIPSGVRIYSTYPIVLVQFFFVIVTVVVVAIVKNYLSCCLKWQQIVSAYACWETTHENKRTTRGKKGRLCIDRKQKSA